MCIEETVEVTEEEKRGFETQTHNREIRLHTYKKIDSSKAINEETRYT